MKENILALVHPQWRATFARFSKTGEASQAFLDYLDSDSNALRAADLDFDEQADELRAFVELLVSDDEPA
jgi:hypothetical protein